MKYSNSIKNLKNNFIREFKRHDETFEMMSIKSIIKELEDEQYNKDVYTEDNVNIICKFLYERYCDDMIKWKKTIREREKRGIVL